MKFEIQKAKSICNKITLSLFAICLTFAFVPLQSNASAHTIDKKPPAVEITEPVVSPETDALMKRLHELKDLDKSTMDRLEKKDLRKEVRTIEKELKRSGEGIYISVGGAIIILLLLILLV